MTTFYGSKTGAKTVTNFLPDDGNNWYNYKSIHYEVVVVHNNANENGMYIYAGPIWGRLTNISFDMGAVVMPKRGSSWDPVSSWSAGGSWSECGINNTISLTSGVEYTYSVDVTKNSSTSFSAAASVNGVSASDTHDLSSSWPDWYFFPNGGSCTSNGMKINNSRDLVLSPDGFYGEVRYVKVVLTYMDGSTWTGEADLTDTAYAVVNDPIVNEGNTLVFTISKSGGCLTATTLHCSTKDGTAIAGTDYSGLDTTVTFPKGSSSITVNIPTVHREGFQDDRYMYLNIDTPSDSAPINDTQGKGTIYEIDELDLNIILDTLRQMTQGYMFVKLDMLRDFTYPESVSIALDTERDLEANFSTSFDTSRETTLSITTALDTQRSMSGGPAKITVDTLR